MAETTCRNYQQHTFGAQTMAASTTCLISFEEHAWKRFLLQQENRFNGRAECGVETVKYIKYGYSSENGSLGNDRVAKAIMQHRNTWLCNLIKEVPSLTSTVMTALKQQAAHEKNQVLELI